MTEAHKNIFNRRKSSMLSSISMTRSSSAGSDLRTEKKAPIHVVIIGAGYAGCLLKKELEWAIKKGVIRVSVVDKRDFMFHKMGALRAQVQEGYFDQLRIPFTEIFKYAKIIHGEVARICEVTKRIYFKNMQESSFLPFDVLVCATGNPIKSRGDLPNELKTTEQLTKWFAKTSDSINIAQDIVIVGGGSCGVELAGEIRGKYPDKRIRIIEVNNHLLASSISPFSRTFHKKLLASLKKLNIEVIFGERVVRPTSEDLNSHGYVANSPLHTRGILNLRINNTDLILWAGRYSSSSVGETNVYPLNWFNEVSELKIRDTFQIEVRNDVFAFGDVCSLPETKLAVTLPSKVSIISHNILAVVREMNSNTFHRSGGITKGVRHYQMNTKASIYLSLGSTHGVAQIFTGFTLIDKGILKWKCRDLRCQKYWKLFSGKDRSAARTPEESSQDDTAASLENVNNELLLI